MYLELDPKVIRLLVKHKCRFMNICNFSLDWYLFMTIVKQNSENASVLRSDVC